jgi:hypothetical protein
MTENDRRALTDSGDGDGDDGAALVPASAAGVAACAVLVPLALLLLPLLLLLVLLQLLLELLKPRLHLRALAPEGGQLVGRGLLLPLRHLGGRVHREVEDLGGGLVEGAAPDLRRFGSSEVRKNTACVCVSTAACVRSHGRRRREVGGGARPEGAGAALAANTVSPKKTARRGQGVQRRGQRGQGRVLRRRGQGMQGQGQRG